MSKPPIVPRNAELTRAIEGAKRGHLGAFQKAGPRSDLTEIRFRLNNPHRRKRPITLAKVKGL